MRLKPHIRPPQPELDNPNWTCSAQDRAATGATPFLAYLEWAMMIHDPRMKESHE